jgi:hypothetical protein
MLPVLIATSEHKSTAQARSRSIVINGPGRYRLLSIIAAALAQPSGFLFLRSDSARFDE